MTCELSRPSVICEGLTCPVTSSSASSRYASELDYTPSHRSILRFTSACISLTPAVHVCAYFSHFCQQTCTSHCHDLHQVGAPLLRLRLRSRLQLRLGLRTGTTCYAPMGLSNYTAGTSARTSRNRRDHQRRRCSLLLAGMRNDALFSEAVVAVAPRVLRFASIKPPLGRWLVTPFACGSIRSQCRPRRLITNAAGWAWHGHPDMDTI